VDLILIAVLALIALQLVVLQRKRCLRWLARPEIEAPRRARLTTLLHAAEYTLRIAILAVAGLMALTTVGINIAPALASLGLIGLALSLGAQTLIKDCIGGVVILIDNLLRVGDVVKIEDVTGTVERITLRATIVRDMQGRLVSIPNGDVRTVANATFDWARAVVDLSVPFDADMNRVERALEVAMKRLASEPETSSDLMEVPQIRSWSGMSDWAIQVRMMVKTAPGRQFDTERRMRRHAVEALAEAGVPLAVRTTGLTFSGK